MNPCSSKGMSSNFFLNSTLISPPNNISRYTFLGIKKKKLEYGKNISQKVYLEILLDGEISVELKRKLRLIPLEEHGFMNC